MSKSKHSATLISCLFFVMCNSVGASSANFRGAKWYDTIEKVKSTETAIFIECKTEELNIAVNPAKPFNVEHLYYKDKLLGKPVLVLYRFDPDCKQLYQGAYVFKSVLSDSEIYKLISAIEDKYKIKLETEYLSEKMYSHGKLNESTTVNINQNGLLHIHRNKTVIYYQTANVNWATGWTEGTEPSCRNKTQKNKKLMEKL